MICLLGVWSGLHIIVFPVRTHGDQLDDVQHADSVGVHLCQDLRGGQTRCKLGHSGVTVGQGPVTVGDLHLYFFRRSYVHQRNAARHNQDIYRHLFRCFIVE